MPNRKAGERRLADMSQSVEVTAWRPELPVEGPPWEPEFVVAPGVKYIQRLGMDERGQVAAWAVIQMRYRDGHWARVAVYDVCHGKSLHVHLYDAHEVEFDEHVVVGGLVRSREDFEDRLDLAIERVTAYWQENERRSDRGR